MMEIFVLTNDSCVYLLLPGIILWNVFGRSDRAVGVAQGVARAQVLVGGEDGGPAVEADDGRDQIHGEAHQAVDSGQLEQGHHRHDAYGAREDHLEQREDEERDQEAAHLGAHPYDEEEREEGGDPYIDGGHEDDAGEPVPHRGHDAADLVPGPVVHFQ